MARGPIAWASGNHGGESTRRADGYRAIAWALIAGAKFRFNR